METIATPAAAARFAELVDRTAHGEAFEIVGAGHPPAVLLSAAEYDQLAKEAHAVSMRRAVAQLDAGHGRPLHVAMDEVRAKLLVLQAAQEGGAVE